MSELAAPSKSWSERLAGLRALVLPLVALVLWEVLARRDAAHAYVFVPLEQVLRALAETLASGELWHSWTASLGRTGAGLVAGSLAGVALGAAMAIWRPADLVINPIFHAVRQVPVMGYIPLISLWAGNGEASKLFVIALAAFYPMALSTYEGVKRVDPRHLAVGQIFLADRWQTLRFITLPGALPWIVTGLLQAVAFAWLSSIGGELFFNPGPGLGNLMLNAQAAFRMDIVIVAVVAIGLTGFLTTKVVNLGAGRLLAWRDTR
jgi:sulfonate transport system permease protein